MGRYDEQGTTLYVSRGIGLEGMAAPRIRLLCPPEITMVTLQGKVERWQKNVQKGLLTIQKT